MWPWLGENWFTILNAVGIIGGLVFTAVSLRSETKTRKVANLLAITANHREIWKEVLRQPELLRILDSSAKLGELPVTAQEYEFVNFVVLHLSSMYEALDDRLMVKQEGLRRDVEQFFSLPIPKAVWEKARALQNQEFVEFVEQCLRKS